MFKKLIPLLLLLAACGEEKVDKHANFPRLHKAPQQILKKQYVDGVYVTVEKRLFTYDAHGRVLSDKNFAIDGNTETLLDQKLFVWGEDNRLLWMEENNTLKTFMYKGINTIVPRIQRVLVEKKYGNELVYDHELLFDTSDTGKLLAIYKYNKLKDIVGRTDIQTFEAEAKQVVTEQERTEQGWRVKSTVTYTYDYGEPDHLHGLKSIDGDAKRTEYELLKDELVGWQNFKYFDGNLIPLERAFVTETEEMRFTRIEEMQLDTLVWNPKWLYEVTYTSNGTSLFWEGPWSTESAADSIISKEFNNFYKLLMCV